VEDRALVATHRDALRRYIGSKIGNRHDADDITQQTLLRALRKLDSFQGGHLRAWLFCIARHVMTNRWRAAAQIEFASYDDGMVRTEEETLRTPPDIIEALCDARTRVQRCLECIATRLRPNEEVAVLMSDVHGFSDLEAASRLRMGLGSYKSLLHKARLRLHAEAAAEQAGNTCPLVSKTGARRACPIETGDGGRRTRPGRRGAPSGGRLGDAGLAALRDELAATVTVEDAPPAPGAPEVREPEPETPELPELRRPSFEGDEVFR
jgi:RNA polymerase sigma factor (sigma-70 family)